MTTDVNPQGNYVDISAIPIPPGHVALEYDKDGSLLFVWDTNALDHSRWSMVDFEDAVLAAVLESGSPKNVEDLTILAAARRAQVYTKWCAQDVWESKKNAPGQSTDVEETTPNPLLDPIENVTLAEYAQVQMKTAEGVNRAVILAALGIDPAVWDEAGQGWLERIRSDSTSVVSSEFSRLYKDGITDPRLIALGGVTQSTNTANVERLRTDRTFVAELSAARSAAFGAGLDGVAWIMETFGISPSDFQAAEQAVADDDPQALLTPDGVTEQWRQLSLRAAAGDEGVREYIRDHMTGRLNWLNLQQAYFDAYVQRFTAQMGGGIADDITF